MIKVGLSNAEITPPLWFLAELTYACPLQCSYCSNPVEFSKYKSELSTEDWIRILHEARELGAAQLGFSGGEPLVRKDLPILVKEARQLGFYTNLITSTVGMNENTLTVLKEAGLDTIQISIQAGNKELNDYIAGTQSFEHKIAMAKRVKELGFPLILNFVLHRYNIEQVEDLIKMGIELNADYMELANTQYYGFALLNRNLLMPSREQIQKAEEITHRYQEQYKDKMKIYFVVPDYFENRPKPCMAGWGKVFMMVTPDGFALPCHSARIMKELDFPSVRDHSLRWIWEESTIFNRFRGESWMKKPCRTCPERGKDFGGCHCQAYALTGDANNADPVCSLSPHRNIIDDAIEEAANNKQDIQSLIFRNTKNSKKMSF